MNINFAAILAVAVLLAGCSSQPEQQERSSDGHPLMVDVHSNGLTVEELSEFQESMLPSPSDSGEILFSNVSSEGWTSWLDSSYYSVWWVTAGNSSFSVCYASDKEAPHTEPHTVGPDCVTYAGQWEYEWVELESLPEPYFSVRVYSGRIVALTGDY